MPARRGSLRVIGGSLRGRRLRTVRGSSVRPTSERVREALFDILGPLPAGYRVLDACAGTGAVGIEALSRGAAQVVFVEREPAALDVLRMNLGSMGDLCARGRIVALDLAHAVGRLAGEGMRFDLLFLDPPYEGGELDRALRLVGGADLAVESGILVAQHESREALGPSPRWRPTRTAAYGRTALTFFRPVRAVDTAGSRG